MQFSRNLNRKEQGSQVIKRWNNFIFPLPKPSMASKVLEKINREKSLFFSEGLEMPWMPFSCLFSNFCIFWECEKCVYFLFLRVPIWSFLHLGLKGIKLIVSKDFQKMAYVALTFMEHSKKIALSRGGE